jgi:hypothetical protein
LAFPESIMAMSLHLVKVRLKCHFWSQCGLSAEEGQVWARRTVKVIKPIFEDTLIIFIVGAVLQI